MNARTLGSVLALVLTAAPVYAEKIDCESMVEVAASLDQVSSGMAAGAPIDDETDASLAELVDALRLVAEAEQNANFDAAIDDLESAWHNMDRDAFVAALEKVDALFAAFYVADC